MNRREIAIVLALTVAAAPSGAQAPADRVASAVDVVEIEVPVQVLLDGRPVRGLSRDDFVLVAGGKRREILGFTEVDLTAPAGDREPGEPPPLAARRHFLLLFDLSFAGPDKVLRARDAALTIVRRELAPSDLVSIATFSLGRGVNVVLGFTPDREQVELAIAGLGRRQLAERVQDPLGLVFVGPESGFDSPSFEGGPSARLDLPGRESDDAVRRLLEEEKRAVESHAQATLTEALTRLAETLRPVPGRKHVLYVSEGSSSALLLGIGRGATTFEQQRIERINEASLRGEVWNVDSNTRFGSTHHLVQFETMLEEFVRAGAAIQTIDIGGLRAEPGAQATGEDTLFMMAEKTGGQFIRNFNELDLAMSRVLARTAVSYVLTFAAPTDERGGRYRRIKVRLAPRRRGARIHHRPGYFTPLPYAERSPEARRAEAAHWILADRERRELELEVAVGSREPSAARPGNVAIDLAVARDSLPTGERPPLTVEIYGYVLDAEGRIVAHFDRVEPLARATGDALSYRADLFLPPGSYELRLLVREDSQGATATRAVPFAVGGRPAAERSLGPSSE